ncbi:MAG: YraN family protein [Bacteroidota bacterium]|nr:YraN family protein [Bacteroidota bacterium]
MAEHNDLGREGEIIAVNYLRENGYSITEKNWRYHELELDIIAKKDDMLIVFEVKTRRNNYFMEPEASVTKAKQKQILKGANAYISYKNLNMEVRFDIISIILNEGEYEINHIEDAFSAVS